MTNVPQRVRDLWTDVYVLLDRNYLMENNKDSWDSFWQQATEIGEKYKGCPYLIQMFDVVSSMISDRMKRESGQADEKKPETSAPEIQQQMGLF